MTDDYNQILQEIESGEPEETLRHIRSLIATPSKRDDATMWFLMGKVLWKLGRSAEATTAFKTSVMLDPQGPGKVALEMATDITDFFNPDLLNP